MITNSAPPRASGMNFPAAPIAPSQAAAVPGTAPIPGVPFQPIPSMYGSFIPQTHIATQPAVLAAAAAASQPGVSPATGLLAPTLQVYTQPFNPAQSVVSPAFVAGVSVSGFDNVEQPPSGSSSSGQFTKSTSSTLQNTSGSTNGDLMISLGGQSVAEQRSSGSVSSNSESDNQQGDMPADASPTQIKERIRQQIEFYFSPDNLSRDKYLTEELMDPETKYVKLEALISFPRVKKLTEDMAFLVEALRESEMLQLDPEELRVRERPRTRCTVIMREVPSSTPKEEIEKLFEGEGCPAKPISIQFVNLDSWYLTFENENEAQLALSYLRAEVGTFLGNPIKARIKAAAYNIAPAPGVPGALPGNQQRRRPGFPSGDPSPGLPPALSPTIVPNIPAPVSTTPPPTLPGSVVASQVTNATTAAVLTAIPTPPLSVSSGTNSSLGPNVSTAQSATPTPANGIAPIVAGAAQPPVFAAGYPAWPAQFLPGQAFYPGIFPGAQAGQTGQTGAQAAQQAALGQFYAAAFQQPGAQLPHQVMLALQQQQQAYFQQVAQSNVVQQQNAAAAAAAAAANAPSQPGQNWAGQSGQQTTPQTGSTSTPTPGDQPQPQAQPGSTQQQQAPRMFAASNAGPRPALLSAQVFPPQLFGSYTQPNAAVAAAAAMAALTSGQNAAMQQALQAAAQGQTNQGQGQMQMIGGPANYSAQAANQQQPNRNSAVVSANRYGQQSGQQQPSGQQSGNRQGSSQGNRYNRQSYQGQQQNQNQQGDGYYGEGPTRHPPPMPSLNDLQSQQRLQQGPFAEDHQSYQNRRGQQQQNTEHAEEEVAPNSLNPNPRSSSHGRGGTQATISPGKSSGYSSTSGSSPSGAMAGGLSSGTGAIIGGRPARGERGTGRFLGDRRGRGGRGGSIQAERAPRQQLDSIGDGSQQSYVRGPPGSSRGGRGGMNSSSSDRMSKSMVGEINDRDHSPNMPAPSGGRGGSHKQENFTLDPGAFPVLEASNNVPQTIVNSQSPQQLQPVSQQLPTTATVASVVAASTQRAASSSPIPPSPSPSPVQKHAADVTSETERRGSPARTAETKQNKQHIQTQPGSSSSSSQTAATAETNKRSSTEGKISAQTALTSQQHQQQQSNSIAQNVQPAQISYAAMLRGKELTSGSIPAGSNGNVSQQPQVSSSNIASTDNSVEMLSQGARSGSAVPPPTDASSPSPSPNGTGILNTTQSQSSVSNLSASSSGSSQQQQYGYSSQRRAGGSSSNRGGYSSNQPNRRPQQQQNYSGRQSSEAPTGSS